MKFRVKDEKKGSAKPEKEGLFYLKFHVCISRTTFSVSFEDLNCFLLVRSLPTFPMLKPRFSAQTCVIIYLNMDNSKSTSLALSVILFCPTGQNHNLRSCLLIPPPPNLRLVSPRRSHQCPRSTSACPDRSSRFFPLPLLVLSLSHIALGITIYVVGYMVGTRQL